MARKPTPRSEDLSGDKKIKSELLKIFDAVEQGFMEQNERTNANLDYWDMYYCRLGPKQQYNGNASVYVPIVHDALNARKTRFVNQLFPQSGRYVEVVDANGDIPHGMVALAEHYVRRCKLRTEVARPLVLNGDVEGQYSLYVSWQENRYDDVKVVNRPVRIDGEDVPEAEEEIEDVEKVETWDAGPDVEVLSDADVLILPVTAKSIDDAMSQGGSATIIRRWTKDAIQTKIDQGLITKEQGDLLKQSMSKVSPPNRTDIKKKHADAAGIKGAADSGRFALVYETWTMLKVDGKKKLCRAYYGGDQNILGCKRNPYFYDRVPLLSRAREKVSGVVKGRSAVEPVEAQQIYANDIMNQGADSATYAMLPIIMTDPEKNPRAGTMVLDLAAIWETNPKDTQFAQFPPLYQHALQIISSLTADIFRTLAVNSAMIPQQTGVTNRRKMNQAEIAQEQQVDILSTAESIQVLEDMFSDLVTWFMWLDHQYRRDDITVKAFGQMGLRVKMEKIAPIRMDNAVSFRWFGVESARNAQAIQQQIAFVNVLRGIPPQLYEGHRLNLVPVLEQACESVFGPRLAPVTFEDLKEQLTVQADLENQLLVLGYDLAVHPMDDDNLHIREHMKVAEPDNHRTVAAHILKHQEQMNRKAFAMAQNAQGPQPMIPGMPGTPGGLPGQPPAVAPGVAGAPRPGSQPQAPRGNYQPPGMISQDRMPAAGAIPFPRKT